MCTHSSSLTAFALFLLVLCLPATQANYLVYRAYWDIKSSADASTCAGAPSTVTIMGLSAGACSQASYTQQCTQSNSDVFMKEICVDVTSSFEKDSLSHRPPFKGTWIEVRTKSTSTSCNQQTLDNTAVIQGWYQNGVCAGSIAGFKSRVYFNSTSAEIRLLCNNYDCEGQCSSSATIPSSSYVQSDVACTSIGNYVYFVRPLQPLPVKVSEYYLSKDCSGTPYGASTTEVASTENCANPMCQSGPYYSIKSFCTSNYVPSYAHAKTASFGDSSCSISNEYNTGDQYSSLGCIPVLIGSTKAECNATHYKTASCDAGCGTCVLQSEYPLNTCQYLGFGSNYKRYTCALGSANDMHSNAIMGMLWTVVIYLLLSILI